MERDIKERHLLRLGQGERDLHTDEDFSKYGRVAASMERRDALLAQVARLGNTLHVAGDVGYTCETASYFHLHHVQSRIEKFRADAAAPASRASATWVRDNFPFQEFFASAPAGLDGLFAGASFDADMESAEACFRHLDELFEDLDGCVNGGFGRVWGALMTKLDF